MVRGERWDYIIWDFNGTILDDVETGIASVNVLLKERGLPLLASAEEYRGVFGFPIQSYYERLGFDFEREPYEAVAPLWVEQYLSRVDEAPIFDDVKATLDFFRAQGIRQIVLSATEARMLSAQVEHLGISDYFEELLGLDNIHAASKIALATDWRLRHPEARVLLLGDTDHDAQTARRIGAACVLIARGHQSEQSLRMTGVPIFGSLKEWLKAINEQ